MGAKGAMSPRRVQDPEGAKTITISYNSPAGAIATIVKRRFLITCYTKQDIGRLRLDPALTTGIIAGARTCAKKILIYDAIIHSLSDLDPTHCGPGTTPRDRITCVVNILKTMEQFTAVIIVDQDERPEPEDLDTSERHAHADTRRGATTQTMPQNAWQATPGHGKATSARSGIQQVRASKGATPLERRSYNALVDNATKHKYTNKFQPVEEEQSDEGRGSDRVREGSV